MLLESGKMHRLRIVDLYLQLPLLKGTIIHAANEITGFVLAARKLVEIKKMKALKFNNVKAVTFRTHRKLGKI